MRKQIIMVFIIVLVCLSIFIPTFSQEPAQITNSNELNSIIYIKDINLERVIREKIHKPKGDILFKDVKGIKELIAYNREISEIGGIENLISLERLDLDSNKIESIEPLRNLQSLRILRLGSNRIHNITPLATLINLEHLCLWSNKIKDISPIEKLIKLEELRLAYNEIEDISPLKNLKNLKSLNALHNNINNLEPLRDLKNLQKLYLMENNIQDIKALKNLENLERLKLEDNIINDIEPLNNLDKLKLLSLSNNNIWNIKPVSALRSLEYLELSSNSIVDISAIENLYKLNKLFLDDNYIVNIVPLKNMSLSALSLSRNRIEKLDNLGELKELLYLNLSNNQISNLEPIEDLIKLRWLYLDKNNIKEIGPLKNMVSLRKLSVSHNSIENISIIKGFKNLEELYISDNNIIDITPVSSLSKLVKLEVQNNNINSIKPAMVLKNIENIKTYGNPFANSNKEYGFLEGEITVKGKIIDIYNNEYGGSGARVLLKNIGDFSNKIFIKKANEFGEFDLQNVDPGDYKIVFTKKGYKPLTLYRKIENAVEKVNVRIEPQASASWNELISDRVIYYYKDGIQVSNIENEILKDKLEEIEEFLGVVLSEKIKYYFATYSEEIYELAYDIDNNPVVGTYVLDNNSLYTINDSLDFHEITHGVEQVFNPHYNQSLGEGLAVFFGGDESGEPILLGRPVNDLARELIIKNEFKAIDEILLEFKDDNDYIIAGSLVSFLLNEYSRDEFLQLFKEFPRNPTKEEVEKIIEKIYNKSIYNLNQEWLEYIGV